MAALIWCGVLVFAVGALAGFWLALRIPAQDEPAPRCEACGGTLGVNVDGEQACSNYGCARWMQPQAGQEVSE